MRCASHKNSTKIADFGCTIAPWVPSPSNSIVTEGPRWLPRFIRRSEKASRTGGSPRARGCPLGRIWPLKPRLPRPLPAPSVFPSGSVVEYQWDLDCIEIGTDTRRCVFNSPDQAFPRAAQASIFLVVKFVTPSRQYPVYAWSVTSADGQIAWGLTEVPSQFHYSAAQMTVGWAGVPQPP